MGDLLNEEMSAKGFKSHVKIISDADKKVSLIETQEAQMKDAFDRKVFMLEGESVRDNMTADWAHFDFLIAYCPFKSGVPYIYNLKALWSELWRYLDPLFKSYEVLTQQYKIAVEEADLVLQVHANDIIQLRLHKKWVKKFMSKGQRREFVKWYDKEIAAFNLDMEDIRKQERERDLDKRLN